jgi:hypothetical protein
LRSLGGGNTAGRERSTGVPSGPLSFLIRFRKVRREMTDDIRAAKD